VNAILKLSDVQEQFQVLGAEAGGGTPADFMALIKREVKTWADVVKAIQFKPL
jgi:hypothetical protein